MTIRPYEQAAVLSTHNLQNHMVQQHLNVIANAIANVSNSTLETIHKSWKWLQNCVILIYFQINSSPASLQGSSSWSAALSLLKHSFFVSKFTIKETDPILGFLLQSTIYWWWSHWAHWMWWTWGTMSRDQGNYDDDDLKKGIGERVPGGGEV